MRYSEVQNQVTPRSDRMVPPSPRKMTLSIDTNFGMPVQPTADTLEPPFVEDLIALVDSDRKVTDSNQTLVNAVVELVARVVKNELIELTPEKHAELYTLVQQGITTALFAAVKTGLNRFDVQVKD